MCKFISPRIIILRFNFFKKIKNRAGCVFLFIVSLTTNKATVAVKRTLFLVGRSLVLLSVLACAVNGQASEVKTHQAKMFYFDIPQQSLIKSLHAITNQTETLILFPYSLVERRQGNAVRGRLSTQDALKRLLRDTGLQCIPSSEGVMTIAETASYSKNRMGIEKMNNRKNILAATIGFFAGAGMVSGAMGQEGKVSDADMAYVLEEIVVTATKRETSLQDTAMSISAIGGETIDKRNLVGMEDYLPYIPGVSMQDRGAGQNNIVIRGISVGSQFATGSATGVYFGETPVTGLNSTAAGEGGGSGDIKMVDIERVEVLRGPQGTISLYFQSLEVRWLLAIHRRLSKVVIILWCRGS
jgi:iron complex outermembrane receptor protein